MTTQVETVDINTLVSDIRGKRLRYPVTENGLFCGVITQADLNKKNASDSDIIKNYIIKDAFTTHPDIDVSLLQAASKSAKYPINFIPVISHGLVVGCVTSTAFH